MTFAVYAYRDLLPLGTFTLTPEDLSEGWFLWVKVGLLSVTGILIPLLVPRPYIAMSRRYRREGFVWKWAMLAVY